MKKSKKVIIFIACGITLVLMVVLGVTLFGLNFNLSSAQKPEIIDDGHSIYLKADATDYTGYRFRLTSGGRTFYIDSMSLDVVKLSPNVVKLSGQQDFEPGKSYKIAVCYLGELEGNNSSYSGEVSWDSYDYLESPVLTLTDERLEWSIVKNAQTYLIECGDYHAETSQTYISLQDLPSGENEIRVSALNKIARNARGEYAFKQSDPSKMTTKIVHTFQPFIKVEFSTESKTLTIIGHREGEGVGDFLTKIDIYIKTSMTTRKYTLVANGYENPGDRTQVRYDFDLREIWEEGASIGACPTQLDENNVFTPNDASICWWGDN